jgi:hypothetical protein
MILRRLVAWEEECLQGWKVWGEGNGGEEVPPGLEN